MTNLPETLGRLPLGHPLHRTDPNGSFPAPIAIVGIYPAVTRTARYTLPDGRRITLPIGVERKSFEGSASGADLRTRYFAPLGLAESEVFLIDLYPYYLANTARGRSGRTMADNIELYRAATGEELAVKARPDSDTMLRWCQELPGNKERLASWFTRCAPALVITLGNEAAALARGYSSARAAQRHLYEDAPPLSSTAFGPRLAVVHCAHPGLFTRKATTWNARHDAWCAGPGLALVAAARAAFASARAASG